MMRGLAVFLALTSHLSNAAFFSSPTSFGDWEKVDEKLPSSKLISFKIALEPKNRELIQSTLLDIATPGSKNFRQYLNPSEIKELVSPIDENLNRAISFIHKNNGKILNQNQHGDWLEVEASIENIESMFNVKLSKFKNKRTGMNKFATSGTYEIPSEIDDVIKLVSGLNSFYSSNGVSYDNKPEIASTITPTTIYDTYGTLNASTATGTKMGSQAVIEFGRLANFNTADLETFFETYVPIMNGETCGVSCGTNNGDIRGSVEANLDVQYIMATGTFIDTTTYKITDGGDIEDEMLNYAYFVNNETSPQLVHSISYGEYGGSYDNSTDHQFDYELQKMGLSGISVLLASGDNGVGCNAAGTEQEFDFPDSPHITMVGATYLDSSSKLEVGATLSSGGFSKDFMRPPWQEDVVDTYLSSTDVTMPSESFYAPGRAYPDISAFGQNVEVIAAGKSEAVSGTSCSAPIFAGVVALINHELMSRNMPTLGWLNPWLYANPDMFTDVLTGSNPYEKCDGFEATTGWDPVTGLGTPIYDKMLSAALAASP
jgi:tripeptidyl-peptidase-1